MRVVAVSCALLLPAGNALAQPQEWAKGQTPEVLTTVVVKECPDSAETYRNAVDSVLVRSRMRPFESVNANGGDFYLQAELLCYEIPDVNDRYAASVSVSFGGTNVPMDKALPRRRWLMGTNSRHSVLYSLKKRTEAAVNDYLEAN